MIGVIKIVNLPVSLICPSESSKMLQREREREREY